ncbi:unnamed protein product, partial [Ilex paraguariensis]
MALSSTSRSGLRTTTPPPADRIPNWLALPPDVTTTILHKVGVADTLMSAQKVCTTWRRTCKEPSMWRVIDTNTWRDLFSAVGGALLKRCKLAVDMSQGLLVDICIHSVATDDLFLYITHR